MTSTIGRNNRALRIADCGLRIDGVCELRIRNSQSEIRNRVPHGFTLAEMLLVLGLILVASGLVFPPLLRMLADQPVKDAAEHAREQIAHVRLKALDTSSPWLFRFEPGGGHFLWMPEELAATSAGSSNTTSTQAAATQTAATTGGAIQTGELSKGIVFGTASNGVAFGIERLPPEMLAGQPNAYELGQVGWSVPLVFQADGSSVDLDLAVVDSRNKQVRLHIRGLTGALTVTPMETRGQR